jgi:hypothetical protein
MTCTCTELGEHSAGEKQFGTIAGMVWWQMTAVPCVPLRLLLLLLLLLLQVQQAHRNDQHAGKSDCPKPSLLVFQHRWPARSTK